jgi:hypothetical protein
MATLFRDLIKGSVIERDSRVGNDNMPRSLASEGKWLLHICVADLHHLAEGAILDTR